MTRQFRSDDGLTLAYDDTGTGHPLLCLAGLTRNMEDFAPVAERFAGCARVIRLDSRGRGRSDHDPDWRNYTIVREGQDALALLDHLGIASASILGTSRGGLIAMWLAVAHPERVRGIILNDIGPVIEPDGLAAIMDYLGRRPAYATIAEAARALPAAMAPGFRNVPAETWRAHAERLWTETPEGLEIRYDAHLRDAVLEQSATGSLPDPWTLFDGLGDIPLGLVRGANSDLLSAATAAEMRRRRPDMLFAEIPDRGHVPFLDEPEAVRLIETYLERAA